MVGHGQEVDTAGDGALAAGSCAGWFVRIYNPAWTLAAPDAYEIISHISQAITPSTCDSNNREPNDLVDRHLSHMNARAAPDLEVLGAI